MQSDALARALKDFGARPGRAAEPFVVAPELDEFQEIPFAFEAPPLPPAVDTDALIAAAVTEAEAALTARLTEEHAHALQIERDRHAEELMEQQRQFADEAAVRISASFEEMESRVVELTSAITARILGVVMTDSIRERSIERLAAIIRDAHADNEAVRVRVRGSLALYEELKLKLPNYAEQLDFAEGANFDIVVTIDDSVFETRLAEWSAALAEALS